MDNLYQIDQEADSIPFEPLPTDLISTEVGPALRELAVKVNVSASPGYTWGRSGNVGSGSWLLNDSVPSNTTGRKFSLYNGLLAQISVSNDDINTFTIGLYEHNKVVYTLLGSVPVVASTGGEVVFTGVNVTNGKELAVKIISGSAKNPVVQCVFKGSLTP